MGIKGPRKNHKRGIDEQQKAQRKLEAETRQAEYNKLTPQEKLARLDAGGFTASKQRAKLAALVAGR